jgi:hypothetical protein
MKHKIIILLFLLTLMSFLGSQETLQEISTVINIEVPVRVFSKGDFVQGLKLKDFELWEDGVSQKIEAVYQIKKDIVMAKDEPKKKFRPDTGRTFFLLFETSEYLPKIGNAIKTFVNNILQPNDSLIISTALKTYRLKDKGLEHKTKDEIIKEMRSIIRKDSYIGNAEYRSSLKEVTEIAQALSNEMKPGQSDVENRQITQMESGTPQFEEMEIESMITMYTAYLQKLDTLRRVEEARFYDFAKFLKGRDGQKYVFLFYQREFVPQIDWKIYTLMLSEFQDVEGTDISYMTSDLFDVYKRDVTIDVENIKKAFADSSALVNFLFITKTPDHIPGVTFAEQSNDIFAPFLEMAKATGGHAESSANPNSLFQNAVKAAENYYLLYYTPKNYRADGEFKKIKVKIKGKSYRVLHRAGYKAD